MRRYVAIFVTGWFAAASFAYDAFADDGVKTLGVGTSTLTADGPMSVQVNMGECQFSIALKKGEHIKYNNPDLIFYRSNARLTDQDIPFLHQVQTYSGYDWWFEKRGAVHVPWIGFMCENASDFKWSPDNAQTDVPTGLQDIIDANSLRCPADFIGGKWIRTQKSGASFRNLDVVGGQGFLVDETVTKKNSGGGSRFCFVHGGNVLIGVSGGAGLWPADDSKSNSLVNVLRDIKFKSDDVPGSQ